MGLLDEIRKALESQQKSDFIDQILKEKGLHDALHDAGFTIVVDDPQARARQQPYGVLSTIQKIDLIDLIELINRIKLIDEITLISTIATVGSMTLLDRITQLDKIHPDVHEIAYIEIVCPAGYGGMYPAIDDLSLMTATGEQMVNGDIETGDFTGFTVSDDVITGVFKHSGNWAVRLDPAVGNFLRQTFATPIPVANVTSLTFWGLVWLQYTVFANVTIGYTDGTTTVIPIGSTAVGGWEQWDLTSYLEAFGAHTVIDKIVSMPAVTGTVSVTGSQIQLLLQRALTYDLIVQLRSDGVEIDPRAIRPLTAADIVTILCANLDVALSTRALESGGNLDLIVTGLGLILAQLDSKTSTLFKATQNIGNTSFGATQATRTSLKVQPEREDIVSLGGVASPSAAGVEIVAASGALVPKVYDAEYEGLANGLHYFYFGISTSPTTKRFLSRNTTGVNSKTFVQPRVGAAGDGIYLYSSVAETNMPYDLGYKLE